MRCAAKIAADGRRVGHRRRLHLDRFKVEGREPLRTGQRRRCTSQTWSGSATSTAGPPLVTRTTPPYVATLIRFNPRATPLIDDDEESPDVHDTGDGDRSPGDDGTITKPAMEVDRPGGHGVLPRRRLDRGARLRARAVAGGVRPLELGVGCSPRSARMRPVARSARSSAGASATSSAANESTSGTCSSTPLGIRSSSSRSTPAMLFVGTVIVAIAVGADVPTSLALVGEFAPERARARLLGSTQVAWSLGPVVVLLLALRPRRSVCSGPDRVRAPVRGRDDHLVAAPRIDRVPPLDGRGRGRQRPLRQARAVLRKPPHGAAVHRQRLPYWNLAAGTTASSCPTS